jgi:hypothetical protein
MSSRHNDDKKLIVRKSDHWLETTRCPLPFNGSYIHMYIHLSSFNKDDMSPFLLRSLDMVAGNGWLLTRTEKQLELEPRFRLQSVVQLPQSTGPQSP